MSENDGDNESVVVTEEVTVVSGTSASAFVTQRITSAHRDRKDRIVQQVTALDDDDEISQELHDDIRYFFLWGYTVIEHYSAHLIRTYVIDDSFQNETWSYFNKEMSQSHREGLLKESGIFDGIQGRIGNLRGHRNDFAHNPSVPIDWEDDNIEAKMEQMIDIIDKLDSALDNEEVANDGLE